MDVATPLLAGSSPPLLESEPHRGCSGAYDFGIATPWEPPADAQPVHGWGTVTLDPAREYAELIEVAPDGTLAVASLTFSDRSSYDPPAAATLQFETAAPGQPGQPGDVMSQFYQLTLPLGGTQHLAFPIPLVLTGLPGEAWVLRMNLVGTRVADDCETSVLAVGCVF